MLIFVDHERLEEHVSLVRRELRQAMVLEETLQNAIAGSVDPAEARALQRQLSAAQALQREIGQRCDWLIGTAGEFRLRGTRAEGSLNEAMDILRKL